MRKEKESLSSRIRHYFEINPDESLTAADAAIKFDCSVEMASTLLSRLVQNGLPESCFIKVRQRVNKRADYPWNLTASERESLEAYASHGTIPKTAVALSLSPATIADNLKQVRAKAGVTESVVAVAMYIRAQAKGELEPA